MAAKYHKRPLHIPTFSVLMLYKIYPNWDFWFENIPSGNPGAEENFEKRFCLNEAKLK
jgi:hypothetical protein